MVVEQPATGPCSSSTPSCLRSCEVTMPTTASRGTSGNWTSIASRSQRHGGSGWSGERAQSGSHGHASTRSSHAIPFPAPRSSIATQPPAKLSREEPDARNLHVRVYDGGGGRQPHLLGV